MPENLTTAGTAEWLGNSDQIEEVIDVDATFGGGKIWIGEHTADGDILVFDPAESSPTAERLSFFSLTQLRTRVFPRAVVARQIREITDRARATRAKKDYARRAELGVARASDLATARVALTSRQRGQVIERHERYLAGHGLPYKGVIPTPKDRKTGKRVRCHECGIALDDFVGTVCGACSDVLCSCGACACGTRARKAAATP